MTAKGNFVAEWFGYRTYPSVRLEDAALRDQRDERCPFLSTSVGEDKRCVKAPNARGVCTVNTATQSGGRADWLVCPYRALDDSLVGEAISTLFGCSREEMHYLPGPALKHEKSRVAIADALARGHRSFVYFNAKLGGELSVRPTPASPQFSFDLTIIEIVSVGGLPSVGRFGIMEIQTMDFHGSYRYAVKNLKDGLRLHGDGFPKALQENSHWISDHMEGPNISNVFKRTFYQLAFKFEAGETESSAGCVLAIPEAVWVSWQPHLGAPKYIETAPGYSALVPPGAPVPAQFPGWIFVFQIEDTDEQPSSLRIVQRIGMNVPALVHYALEEAPKNAIRHMQSEHGLYWFLEARLKRLWPELARTVKEHRAIQEPDGASVPLRKKRRRSPHSSPQPQEPE